MQNGMASIDSGAYYLWAWSPQCHKACFTHGTTNCLKEAVNRALNIVEIIQVLFQVPSCVMALLMHKSLIIQTLEYRKTVFVDWESM